ncbi:glycosyl hydrolase [Naematelia encephala]|uniref:Glycosyl hydrolase n=1 Tax=Naematelia encephala TaxID=71784 RepID=A0A1Y2AR84_9TREE|nr:glycosyl hydrolase [Naematelia encephala]
MSTSEYVESGLPTGTPIPGDYSGPLRPQVHFSPPQGFMNDPNGMFVDANGTWHLYYQYNPTGLVPGNTHWGHATSQDLYHWTNQPIALFPENSTALIFTGSCVVDVNNTSGFFPDQDNGVVAIYTLNTPTEEVQQISYSFDGGYSFERYDGNPVLRIGSTQFRDPKVIWYNDHWVMVIAFAQDFAIGIYTSADLKEWKFASNVTHVGILGNQYECPNLVQVPVEGSDDAMWVLTISINPGAPQGGSITQYIPGDFNGTHFTPVDQVARTSSFAKDDYAAQFFYGTPAGSDAISIGWASNWQYTDQVPTAWEGWRSAMTIPRRHYLKNLTRTGWDLISAPYNLDAILGGELSYDSDFINKSVTVDFSGSPSNAIWFQANFTLASNLIYPSYASLNFSFSSKSTGESVSGGYLFGGANAGQAWLDRGRTYAFDNPFYTNRFSIAQAGLASQISALFDRSIIEMFLDGGDHSGTATFFPSEPLTRLTVATTGMPEGSEVRIGVWQVNSAWASMGNNGTWVQGNITTRS